MSFFETKKKNERKVIKKKGIVWKLRENIVYLQRERNLFRIRAPFGLASDLLK